ncbi:PLL family lectin [Phytohabitans suffuscus]
MLATPSRAVAFARPDPAEKDPAATTVSVANQAAAAAKRGEDWRAGLRSDLAKLPQLSATTTVTDTVGGLVVAGTLRMPATVKLTGDTTIIAGTVEFPGKRAVIEGRGHALTFLPVDGVRWGTGSKAAAGATTQGEIEIDANGLPGQTGEMGFPGTPGASGRDGLAGQNVPDGGVCENAMPEAGQSGDTGGAGGDGANGKGGQGGQLINVSIPSGSTDRYLLLSAGGAGGAGGPGGQGGTGGSGGNGGNGGDSFEESCAAPIGGAGGRGGNGGNGGKGGSGAAGAPGGQIFVSYPEGYDRSWITTDVTGGSGGGPGSGGFGGVPGLGGSGGSGGFNHVCGPIPCIRAPSGPSSGPGSVGSGGGPGNASETRGADGRVTFNQVGVTSVAIDKSPYLVEETPTYRVTGQPNTPILWSSWKDGVSTGEVDAYYGQNTDHSGRWSGTGPAWTSNDVSEGWVKQVKVGDRTAQVSFQVRRPPPPDPWLGWGQMPGITVTGDIGFSGPGTRIYARGTDNGVYTSTPGGGWSSMGGATVSAPVGIQREHLKYEVYVRGTDGATYRNVWIAGISQGWQGLGGGALGKPAPVTQNAAFAMVFIRGTDNQLYVNRLTINTWSGWQALGGTLAADPTAVATNSGNVVTVFARGPGGEINYRRWNGATWGAWTALAGGISGDIAAASPDGTRIHLFGRGGTTPYVNQFNGSSWSGFQSLGGMVLSDLVVAATANGMHIVVRGAENRLYINSAPPSGAFGGWRDLGGSTTLPAGVAVDDFTGTVHVFAVNPVDNILRYRSGV